jgi:hypothetical protein
MSGYLLAFIMAQIVPEKKQEILDRAADYAHNRVVCGVHYPTDTEASRRMAYAIFGDMIGQLTLSKRVGRSTCRDASASRPPADSLSSTGCSASCGC